MNVDERGGEKEAPRVNDLGPVARPVEHGDAAIGDGDSERLNAARQNGARTLDAKACHGCSCLVLPRNRREITLALRLHDGLITPGCRPLRLSYQ